MEIGVPTYNASSASYSFRILKSAQSIEQVIFLEESTQQLDLPADSTVTGLFVDEFLQNTKKYFTNPLTTARVLRHLRHTVNITGLPKKTGWYKIKWHPLSFTIKSNDFLLTWEPYEYKESDPIIPSEFTNSTTPRAQSPAPEQTNTVRSIQIHDSLIPVGDLPLSDLPPLSFGTEEMDPAKEEIKRRIREARLKVQLAKLKAQRMEHKYYERYGQAPEDSEESSEFSSDSEEEDAEIPFERHSH